MNVKFPNDYGYEPPSEEGVRTLQKKYGFSDTYAHFLITQNGLDKKRYLDAFSDGCHNWITGLYGIISGDDPMQKYDLDTFILLPYFFPISHDLNKNPYVEVLAGRHKGCIAQLNHKLFSGMESLKELFEKFDLSYDTMTEEERIDFITDGEKTGLLLTIWASSMKEFIENCIVCAENQDGDYDLGLVYTPDFAGDREVSLEDMASGAQPNEQDLEKLNQKGERELVNTNYSKALDIFKKVLSLCESGVECQYNKLYAIYGCVYSLAHLIHQTRGDEKERLIDANIEYSQQALEMAADPAAIRTSLMGGLQPWASSANEFCMEVNRCAGNELGWWMMERGHLGRALEVIQLAVTCINDPSQYYILDTQVRILLKLGLAHEAFLIVNRVLAECPDFDDFQDLKDDEGFRQWRRENGMREGLLQLQKDIYRYEITEFETQEERDYDVEESPKLRFFPVNKLFDISFYGEGYDERPDTKAKDFEQESNFAFCAFLDLLCVQDNAEKVISLTFDGPDKGEDDTKKWNFRRIANSDVVFSNMESLKIQLTNLGDYHHNVIESGHVGDLSVIATLVKKMPYLLTLSIPSAPDKSFFNIGKHPLKELTMQAGLNGQNFIENLAESDNFFQLRVLDFTDLIDDVYDIPAQDFVSFEAFEKLFQSKAFSTVKHFTLRNSILSEEQLVELQKLRRDVQFLFIKARGGRYVSHLQTKALKL